MKGRSAFAGGSQEKQIFFNFIYCKGSLLGWAPGERLVAEKKRPVNLDIGTLRLPITAYVSILHRVSGVVIFFALAVLLWMLDESLSSQQSFDSLKEMLGHPFVQVVVWGSLVALLYHAVAGVRHLLMDLGVGEESFQAGRMSAWIAVGVALASIAVITLWIFV